VNERMPLTRIAEIEQHLAATTNWSLGNLAARDLLAELYAVRAELRVARGRVAELEAERNAFRDQRNNVFATNAQLHDKVTETFEARLRAENETRTVKREFAEAAATVARLVQERGERMKVENALRDEVEELRARVAELEALKPAPIQTCRTCGAGYTYGQPCNTCEFQAQMALAQQQSDRTARES
jgi:chromosome segregation ATPase